MSINPEYTKAHLELAMLDEVGQKIPYALPMRFRDKDKEDAVKALQKNHFAELRRMAIKVFLE